MNIGQIRVDCAFYNVEKNVRTEMSQVFNNEEFADKWIKHLKKEDDILWIEAYKKTSYGEEMILCWW